MINNYFVKEKEILVNTESSMPTSNLARAIALEYSDDAISEDICNELDYTPLECKFRILDENNSYTLSGAVHPSNHFIIRPENGSDLSQLELILERLKFS